MDLKNGKYSITVTRENDDWYRVNRRAVYIRTRRCRIRARREEAILNISGRRSSKLIFLDEGESCDVEQVFEALDL